MDAQAGLSEESRRMITALEMTGNFRVLRRFVARERFAEYASESDRAKAKLAMIIASRSTGPTLATGRLVMLSYVMVRFNTESGVIYEVESVYSGTEDPGAPISASIERAIGATDAQLATTVFDVARINEDIARTSVVVCHNAEVERRFLEARFEGLADKWFVSSAREFPWTEFGASSRNLDVLASVVSGVFYTPGPALQDAQVLADLLARPAPDGQQVFRVMLDVSRIAHWRVWALNAPLERKRQLFDRGFKVGETIALLDKTPVKGWMKVVRSLEGEVAFLAANVYPTAAEIQAEKITGFERYTDRPGQCEPVTVKPPAQPTQQETAASARAPAPAPATARSSAAPAPQRQPAGERRAPTPEFADGDLPI